MASGNPALIEIIRREIVQHGPLAFSEFMNAALYHPQHGYYSSGRAAVGHSGDFFTNVSVGALFGKLLALQFLEMWERLGQPGAFTIVEQGANDGQFAHDVFTALSAFSAMDAQKKNASDFLKTLRYRIIEPFPVLENRQRAMLGAFENVEWRDSLDALEPFTGVHFSNELLDAMPPYLVTFANGEWCERKIAVSEPDKPDEAKNRPDFCFVNAPIENEALRNSLEKILLTANGAIDAIDTFPDGYETEVNLAAPNWIRQLSEKLQRGYLLAIDYGFLREEFYKAERKTGTLSCYANHRRGDNPLTAIGETDITAHVEFTSLIEAAQASGLELAGFTDQHHFMVGLGKIAFPDVDRSLTASEQKERRAFATLMHPQMLGLSFKALALAKAAPVSPMVLQLSGFLFSRSESVE